jgi:hypothetical protein
MSAIRESVIEFARLVARAKWRRFDIGGVFGESMGLDKAYAATSRFCAATR